MSPRTPKPKVGRPPRAGKAARERIELSITSDERRAWERAAGNQPLASWIRSCCEAQLKRTKAGAK